MARPGIAGWKGERGREPRVDTGAIQAIPVAINGQNVRFDKSSASLRQKRLGRGMGGAKELNIRGNVRWSDRINAGRKQPKHSGPVIQRRTGSTQEGIGFRGKGPDTKEACTKGEGDTVKDFNGLSRVHTPGVLKNWTSQENETNSSGRGRRRR